MQYLVRYLDRRTSVVMSETLAAGSEAELSARLAAEMKILLSATPAAGPGRPSSAGVRTTKGSNFDVGWWCQELRTLVLAGMTVVEAIEALWMQAQGGPREALNAQLFQKLQEGLPLSGAMRQTGMFPAVLIAGVTAGERTSTLPQALADYLSYHRLQRELKNKAVSAAIYPSVVVSLGVLIGVFLVVYVVPRFTSMYADFHGTLSAPTRALMFMSSGLRQHGPILGVIGVVLLLLLCRPATRSMLARQTLRALKRQPLLRRGLDNFIFAKLYQSLALMFRGGYTLDEALQVCIGLQLGADMDAGVTIARTAIARGSPVSEAFESAGFTDPITTRLLVVGERSGNFDAVLQAIADRHSEQFVVFVDRATRVLEPALLTLVALMVAGIVVLMYMPIFDMASGIG